MAVKQQLESKLSVCFICTYTGFRITIFKSVPNGRTLSNLSGHIRTIDFVLTCNHYATSCWPAKMATHALICAVVLKKFTDTGWWLSAIIFMILPKFMSIDFPSAGVSLHSSPYVSTAGGCGQQWQHCPQHGGAQSGSEVWL